MSNRKQKLGILSIAATVLAFFAIIGLLASGGNTGTQAAADETSTASTTASAPPAPAAPEDTAVGNEQNTDPVRKITVHNWRDLVDKVREQDDESYKQCLLDRTGVTWRDAKRYAKLVDKGYDLRYIIISNSSITDKEARKRLREQGERNVDDLKIVRRSSFKNTRGTVGDHCSKFQDDRAQVRISLGIPKDEDKPEDMHLDKGVLAVCMNPHSDHVTTPPPAATTQPTSVPPATTQTTKNPPPSTQTTTTVPPATTLTTPPTTPPTTQPTTPPTSEPNQSEDCQQGEPNCPPNSDNQEIQIGDTSDSTSSAPVTDPQSSPTPSPFGTGQPADNE